MSLIQEFKEFAVKGNAVDMAVGVIVGAAFGKVVSSLVADVFMPPIGVVVGGVDFTKLAVTIKEAADNAPAVTLNYGMFIQSIVDFTIIAFVIFLMIKMINSLKKEEPTAPEPAPTKEELLLTEIRDLLKASANKQQGQ
ncbi:MAG: large conductance mechanosensitive channel protein MscL [Methylobacter sp.]|nr:MAG: large conductance mechanosensitive channel protein MscL [Methylobacter sp.]PPD23697.1 MAG: large conductance mechanosensitive channel protein MscL [Methylobacter sp.]PPD32529.1 MAG: large conductance mechanosensitive channel protein MscL [Methylomonas sp.]